MSRTLCLFVLYPLPAIEVCFLENNLNILYFLITCNAIIWYLLDWLVAL